MAVSLVIDVWRNGPVEDMHCGKRGLLAVAQDVHDGDGHRALAGVVSPRPPGAGRGWWWWRWLAVALLTRLTQPGWRRGDQSVAAAASSVMAVRAGIRRRWSCRRRMRPGAR
jgi:hypothetical protein